jgi:predicted dehydrogenase
MTLDGKLALGLVGCGGMGRRHILGMKRLQSVGRLEFELAAVCDLLPENAERAAAVAQEQLGRRPAVYGEVADMLGATKLDAVIVTTTPETHTDVALQAFAAGAHVMAEKPIALTVADGGRLVAAARAAGRKLAVAENYRRDPINRLAKALIDGGAIGRPFLATQSTSGSGEFVIITPWRHRQDRGGIVIDMGVHYTDILEYYLGPIATVAGMNAVVDETRVDAQGVWHPADAEDLSVGVMRFESGAIANWLLSLAGRGEGSFARMVYGTGGSLNVPGDRSGKPVSVVQRRAGADVVVPADDVLALVPNFALDATTAALFGGERLAHYELPWTEIDANLLAIEQADFVEAIVSDREPEVTGEQGLRSLALVAGLLQSEKAGRMLSLDEVLRQAGVARAEHMEIKA